MRLTDIEYFESQDLNYTSIAFNGRSDYDPFTKAGIPAGGVETGAEGIKTKDEQELFGGQAGIAYDVNYHGRGDNVTNLALEPLFENTKAIAHGVATYARSFSSITVNETVSDEEEDLHRRRLIIRSERIEARKNSVVRGAKAPSKARSHMVSEVKVIVRSRRFRKHWS